MLVIPEVFVPEFKRLLVMYYEDRDAAARFMLKNCIKDF